MKDWFRPGELAGLPGLPRTRHRVQMRAKREGWKSRKAEGRRGGGGLEYHFGSLPTAAQTHLLRKSGEARMATSGDAPASAGHGHRAHAPAIPGQASLPSLSLPSAEQAWARYNRASDKQKNIAAMRLRAVQTVEHFVTRGHNKTRAIELVCDILKEQPRTLWRWLEAVRDVDPVYRLAYLLPDFKGRTATSEISPEAWDFLRTDYLRLEAPALTACYDRLKRTAAARGWTIPSYGVIRRKIQREIDAAVIIAAREGDEALARLHPAQERDASTFDALEAVNADGHRFDVFVNWDGEIIRPFIIAWQDIHSRKIIAWRLAKTENAAAVLLSFGDLVEKYGIPRHAYFDQGRAFNSKWMTGGVPFRYRFKVTPLDPKGVLVQLGVNYHPVTPYHGQSKPIEASFGDFATEYIAKHPALAGCYTGNSPAAKPENYGSRAVALEDFEKIVAAEIAAHNARPGRRIHWMNGRSFDAVFSESYACAAIRKATEGQRRLWLLASEGLTVRKRDGSIHLEGNRYWHEGLISHAGKKVVVRFDPKDLHQNVHVYTLDGRYICEARCVGRTGFADSEAAKEHARARNQFKRARKDQLAAERRISTLDAARQIPEPPPEELLPTGVIELMPKRRAAVGSDDEGDDYEEAFASVVQQLRSVRNAQVDEE